MSKLHEIQRASRVEVECALCGKKKTVSPCFLKMRKVFFCSREHSQEHKAKTRNKRPDCKICHAPLKMGEGYHGITKKSRSYVCDKCKTEQWMICAIAEDKRRDEKKESPLLAFLAWIEKAILSCPHGKPNPEYPKTKCCCSECSKDRRFHQLNGYKRRSIDRRRSSAGNMLSHSISLYIYNSLRGRKWGQHWEDIVGYSIEDLKKHLEKLFEPGMTWENRGRAGWHIDHILPLSRFNFESAEDPDFKKAWALKNLQPMWAHENQKKSDKVEKPMQPSLSLFQ